MVRQKQRYEVEILSEAGKACVAEVQAINLHFAKAEANRLWGKAVVAVRAT